jgi:hypothetical protein
MNIIIPSGPITKEVITFNVFVSDSAHHQSFIFTHRVPPDLQKDVTNRPALVAFMDQIVHEHHRELLAAYPWKCNCGRPATTLFHAPISMLHINDDPHLQNLSTPCCFDGSPCWQTCTARLHEKIYHSFDGFMQTITSASNRCGYCAKADIHDGNTLKRCGNCKAVRYCSSECQVADWSNHKKMCRHIAFMNNNDQTDT